MQRSQKALLDKTHEVWGCMIRVLDDTWFKLVELLKLESCKYR